MITGGIKHDNGKPRMDLLPPDALDEVANILSFGATKYGERNWENGFNYGRLIGAALRHIFAFMRGEDLDTETGRSHLGHAACCILMLLALHLRGHGKDDRSIQLGHNNGSQGEGGGVGVSQLRGDSAGNDSRELPNSASQRELGTKLREALSRIDNPATFSAINVGLGGTKGAQHSSGTGGA